MSLTVNEVCAQLNLSRYVVANLIAAYEAGDPLGLPAINVAGTGTGRRYRIEQADVERWKQARKVAAA